MKNKVEYLNPEGLYQRLSELLSHNENGKRDSAIEHVQLDIIKNAIYDLSLKYEEDVLFDLDAYNTAKKENRWFITYDGFIENQSEGYNEWYDSKRFDAVFTVEIRGKVFTLFFILKGVENNGGHQRNVKQEIGMYSKLIQKNKNKSYHFFFVMDGTYINRRINELESSRKYDLATSKSIKSSIEKFIRKNLK